MNNRLINKIYFYRKYDRDYPEWGFFSKSFDYLRGEGFGNNKYDNKYNSGKFEPHPKNNCWFFADYPHMYKVWMELFTEKEWDEL